MGNRDKIGWSGWESDGVEQRETDRETEREREREIHIDRGKCRVREEARRA